MIRINLVPQKRNRRQEAVRGELAFVGGGAILLVILLGLVHGVAVARVNTISSENAALEREINQMKEVAKEVDAAEKFKADLERKLHVIKQLKANKAGPVRMLDELAMSTPDKLQLVLLEENGGRIKIIGISVSNEVISQFLSNLEQSEYFTDVYLNSIDQT
ncbi:MAG: type IV pilus assembly protein PilN, partial [Myxococcota bacterium]